MKNGNVDAVISHVPVIKYYLKTNKVTGYEIVGPMLEATKDAIAVKKGNEALQGEINKAMAELKASGEYDTIYEKWFGEKPAKK